jgi:hypothetical protein
MLISVSYLTDYKATSDVRGLLFCSGNEPDLLTSDLCFFFFFFSLVILKILPK